jgi:hypothetical protein
MLPVFEMPAPNPQEIFFAVSGSRPSSSEKEENTAEEQVNPFLKSSRASSDFVMMFFLFLLSCQPVIILKDMSFGQ